MTLGPHGHQSEANRPVLMSLNGMVCSGRALASEAGIATLRRGGNAARVELGYVDQGYTGEEPAADAAAYGMQLAVVKLPDVKKGFVLLPKRWVVDTTQPQDPPNARLDETERAAHARCGGAARVGRPGRRQARCADRAARGRGRAMSGLAVVAGPPRLRRSGAAVGGSGSRRPTASACWGYSAA